MSTRKHWHTKTDSHSQSTWVLRVIFMDFEHLFLNTPPNPPKPYCIDAAAQLCTCIGHNSQYAERGKGSMKESWLKWEHSIPGHSPEIRVDLWNSSAWGNETVRCRQDLGESFKNHRGMTRSLSFAFSLHGYNHFPSTHSLSLLHFPKKRRN